MPEVVEPMRKPLQAHYDAKGLGPVPKPEGAASHIRSEHLSMLLHAKPQMVSFRFGLPGQEIRDAIKGAGIFVISSATTVAEAKMLERRGVDAIIAQGTEAGGHRGTFTGVDMGMQPGLFALLPQGRRCCPRPGHCRGGHCRRAHRGGRIRPGRKRCSTRNRVPALQGSQRARRPPCRVARGR